MTTTDADALLAAVLADPADDQPRLIYADWLDDNGEDDRAEYIRTAVEHARAGEVECGHRVTHDPGGFNAPCLVRCGACGFCARMKYLEEAGQRHAPDLPVGYAWTHEEDLDTVHRPPPQWPVAIMRRGFIDEVRLTAAALCGGRCPHCPDRAGHQHRNYPGGWERCEPCGGTGTRPGLAAGLAALPLSRVVLTDRGPVENHQRRDGPRFVWQVNDGGINALPESIYSYLTDYISAVQFAGVLKEYPTRDAALDALSLAALRLIAAARPAPG